MREHLFIDGEEVDLKPGSNLTLNFKSNIMGDVSKIEASNSLTINLPKTPRNNSLFGFAGIPASGSTAPYRRWPAKYYRDGVEVISVGHCVLVDVSDTYNVAIYWGTMANFQEWLDSEETLQQLDYSDGPNTSFAWGATPLSDADSSDGVIIANYDTGVGSFDDLPASVGLNPTVRVSSLLSKIEERWGLRFSFSFLPEDTAAGRTILDRWGLPLLTSKGRISHDATLSSFSVFLDDESYGPPSPGTWRGTYGLTFNVPASGFFATDEGQLKMAGAGMSAKRILPASAGVVKIQPNFRIITANSNQASEIIPSLELYAVSMTSDGSFYKRVQLAPTWQQVGYTYQWAFEDGAFYFLDVPEGGAFGFLAVTNNARIQTMSGNFAVQLPEAEADLKAGDQYQAQWNLPEMKQIDFVKAISQMLGLFAAQNIRATDTIAFTSIDTLLRNKANAYDWSSRLIKGQNDGGPETVTFKLDSWARENVFRYKEDESVMADGAGSLFVPNENLEASADVLTLPFAASDWSVVPLYERNNSGGIDRKSIEPRIMQIVSTEDGKAALTFSGLGWPSLLNKYYGGQGRMLSQVVVLKVKVRLYASELKMLSFLRPVYLAQFGRYYAIKSISTSSSEECSVELLQLPLNE